MPLATTLGRQAGGRRPKHGDARRPRRMEGSAAAAAAAAQTTAPGLGLRPAGNATLLRAAAVATCGCRLAAAPPAAATTPARTKRDAPRCDAAASHVRIHRVTVA